MQIILRLDIVTKSYDQVWLKENGGLTKNSSFKIDLKMGHTSNSLVKEKFM